MPHFHLHGFFLNIAISIRSQSRGSGMTAGDIITYVMLFFTLIGAADRALGCRFGLGKNFEKGFEAAGALVLAMIGPIALAPADKRPLLAKGLAIGLVTVPVACFVSGLCFGIGMGTLLFNLLPLIFSALFFAAEFLFFERVTVKIVTALGAVLTAVLTVALAAAVVVKILKLDVPQLVELSTRGSRSSERS